MNNSLLAQIKNPVIPQVLGQGGLEQGGIALGKLIGALTGAILIIAFMLAFFFLITGGISWITASGDKAKLETARDKITNAIVGLIIVAAVWAIMTLVSQFLGLDFPEIKIPTIETVGQSVSESTSATTKKVLPMLE